MHALPIFVSCVIIIDGSCIDSIYSIICAFSDTSYLWIAQQHRVGISKSIKYSWPEVGLVQKGGDRKKKVILNA